MQMSVTDDDNLDEMLSGAERDQEIEQASAIDVPVQLCERCHGRGALVPPQAVEEIEAQLTYALSENQCGFIEDVIACGLQSSLYLDYSGRYMFGRRCPGVVVERYEQLRTTAEIVWDNMGMGYIAYARY